MPADAALVRDADLGREIRAGGWAELSEGTPRLVATALAAGDDARAADLAGFLLTEMRVVYDIYTQWLRDTERCLRDKGMTGSEVDAAPAAIGARLAPYHRAARADRASIWTTVADAVATARDAGLPAADRKAALDRAVETWRDLHDCEVDRLTGLFDLVIRRHGEPALREMYEGWVIGDWFARRYQRFDVSLIPWETASRMLVYLGFEGHHGHLSGTARDGSIDWTEDAEKVTISFAPCGSGGRTLSGEPRDGLPPLEELDLPPLREAHDFTWGETGICAYCAHCCLLHEVMPIARFGYPVRVTEPPRAPLTGESRCSWTVYKDLRAIPEEAYARVGATKPGPDEPLGSAHEETRRAAAAARRAT